MLTRRGFVKGAMGVGAGMALGCASGMRGRGADGRPNVIVVMADDLGFECLGAYGGETYKTPHLDRLARSGMMFRQHFGTPVCSPARAQMLTGRYAFRSGFISIAGSSGAVAALDPKQEVTLANLMKGAGYSTAITGKWHLGWGNKPTTGPAEFDPKQYRASSNIAACGFQEQYCFSGPHMTYGEPVKGKYHPDLYQEWALRYLEGRKGKSRPFFMYYGMGLVHFDFDPTPLHPEGKKNDKKNFPYMIEYLDRQIGELVAKLEETGLRENTLILFSSDNGCDGFKSKLNGREVVGGKSGMKDTGTWVPLLASWPGGVKGGSECGDLTDYTDFLPTICELGGAKAPGDRAIDGRSFVPQLRGEKVKGKEWVYVQLVNKWFIREKKYKLRETGRLYDLSATPFEEKRIEAKDETAEAKEVKKRLAGALVGMLAGEGASKRPAGGAKSEGKATV
ncbi:MAG: sulfatase-like hydrolase/transferase, partial [Planctomycetota bacterium]|nr:sulfatase-like hydrolase/transferase [Planctomycetota bacterium]